MNIVVYILIVLTLSHSVVYIYRQTEAQTDEQTDMFVAPQTQAQTAEKNFFGGRVMMHVIFPESNGEIDADEETWTATDIVRYTQMITDAVEWYKRIYGTQFDYVIDTQIMPTKYEVSRQTVSTAYIWLADILHVPEGYEMDKLHTNIIHDKQTGYDTSFYIVVARNNVTGTFTNRTSTSASQGYAFLNGPYMLVNTQPENSLRAVLAHEMGHIFNALDQYARARTPCTARSGVYNTPNYNSDYGDCGVPTTDSIMKNHVQAYRNKTIDLYAREQMGVRDSDCDGIIDYIDTTHDVCYVTYFPFFAKGGI